MSSASLFRGTSLNHHLLSATHKFLSRLPLSVQKWWKKQQREVPLWQSYSCLLFCSTLITVELLPHWTSTPPPPPPVSTALSTIRSSCLTHRLAECSLTMNLCMARMALAAETKFSVRESHIRIVFLRATVNASQKHVTSTNEEVARHKKIYIYIYRVRFYICLASSSAWIICLICYLSFKFLLMPFFFFFFLSLLYVFKSSIICVGYVILWSPFDLIIIIIIKLKMCTGRQCSEFWNF